VNRKILFVILVAFSAAYFAGCSNNPNHRSIAITTPPPASIAPGASVQITATETGTKALIDWSCTPANTCGSFAPTSTSSGEATTYTAPLTAGPVTITATSESKGLAPVSVDVTIQANQGIAGNFAFYLAGLDQNQDPYSLAGAVLINPDGTLTGEQDFNDGFMITASDQITSGTLSVNADGSGTLTLVTADTSVGVLGTETFTVNFVNSSHALIIESDGSTASGSLDSQTLDSTLSGGFAFAVIGIDPSGGGAASGGVFTITGTTIAGTIDTNDAFAGPITNTSFSGATLGPVDGSGRGTITNGPFGVNCVYYLVNQNAIRIIDMDTTDFAVGSAFSQGTGTFTNSSLGNSVFTDQGNFAEQFLYAAVGEIVPSGGNFTGVADINEQGAGSPGFLDASGIAGPYTISIGGVNGYGNLTINPATLNDVTELGIYMVDPSVNVNDPNNTSGGGGALILDLSTNVLGIGTLVPQASGSFSGNYAVGFQDFFPGGPPPPTNSGEADFVGNATAGATLAGSGTISDPRGVLNNPATVDSATFSGAITADGANPGRFTIPLAMTITTAPGAAVPYGANVYQASSGQLFWIEDGADGLSSVFGGQIQATSTLGAAAAKKVKKP